MQINLCRVMDITQINNNTISNHNHDINQTINNNSNFKIQNFIIIETTINKRILKINNNHNHNNNNHNNNNYNNRHKTNFLFLNNFNNNNHNKLGAEDYLNSHYHQFKFCLLKDQHRLIHINNNSLVISQAIKDFNLINNNNTFQIKISIILLNMIINLNKISLMIWI